MATSFPFLAIAKRHGVSYIDVCAMVESFRRGVPHEMPVTNYMNCIQVAVREAVIEEESRRREVTAA